MDERNNINYNFPNNSNQYTKIDTTCIAKVEIVKKQHNIESTRKDNRFYTSTTTVVEVDNEQQPLPQKLIENDHLIQQQRKEEREEKELMDLNREMNDLNLLNYDNNNINNRNYYYNDINSNLVNNNTEYYNKELVYFNSDNKNEEQQEQEQEQQQPTTQTNKRHKQEKNRYQITKFILWYFRMSRQYRWASLIFLWIFGLSIVILSRDLLLIRDHYKQHINNINNQHGGTSNNNNNHHHPPRRHFTSYYDRMNSLLQDYEKYNSKGDNDNTLNTLSSIIKLSPSFCSAMFRSAQIFALKEQYHDSEDMYLKALDCERWLNLEYIVELSSFYNAFHRYQESISLVNRASIFFPNNTKLEITISTTKNLMSHDNIEDDKNFKFYSCVA